MDKYPTQNLKVVDLVAQIERALGPGRRSGQNMVFLCPFHDDHNPSLYVTNDLRGKGAFWKCFACGKKGDAIDWAREFYGLTFEEALSEMSGPQRITALRPKSPENPGCESMANPPGREWQARAQELVGLAVEALWNWEGERALVWLISRGLCEKTIRSWKIGYIPAERQEAAGKWGIFSKEFRIQRGILIPAIIGDWVWYLKIRLPDDRKGKKYTQIPGSRPALYMAKTLLEGLEVMVFCEGEFDALLLWQEASKLAGVVTLGGSSYSLDVATWGLYLLRSQRRLVAYDMDQSGEEGAKKLAWLGNYHRVEIPQRRQGDKDITDFFLSGGDLREWLSEKVAETATSRSEQS